MPSFEIHEYIDDLVESTLKKTKDIDYVYITNSSTKRKIRFPWEMNKEISGISFIETTLAQYYPIVPIWRYYYQTNRKIENVIIDGISGKITKAWKHIGDNTKNLFVVPHGDQTHYCLSFCDILCTYIHLNLREIKYDKIKELFTPFIDNKNIFSEYVSDKLLDFIVPQFPHSIKPSTHYLHPLYLIVNVKEKDN